MTSKRKIKHRKAVPDEIAHCDVSRDHVDGRHAGSEARLCGLQKQRAGLELHQCGHGVYLYRTYAYA